MMKKEKYDRVELAVLKIKAEREKKRREKKNVVKRYGLWFIFCVVFAAVIYVVVWKSFITDGTIPTGSDLDKTDWLSFFGDYLVFAGTMFLGFVAVWQNKKANDTNKEMLEQADEHRQIDAILEHERYKLGELRRAVDKFIPIFSFADMINFIEEEAKIMPGKTDENLEEFRAFVNELGKTINDLEFILSLFKNGNDIINSVVNSSLLHYHFYILDLSAFAAGIESYENFKASIIGIRENHNRVHVEFARKLRMFLLDAERKYQKAVHSGYTLDELKAIFKLDDELKAMFKLDDIYDYTEQN